MIYYFSGSGNSRAIAKALGSALTERTEAVGGYALAEQGCPGFVLPVYAWGIAPFILDWIGSVKLPDKKPSLFGQYSTMAMRRDTLTGFCARH